MTLKLSFIIFCALLHLRRGHPPSSKSVTTSTPRGHPPPHQDQSQPPHHDPQDLPQHRTPNTRRHQISNIHSVRGLTKFQTLHSPNIHRLRDFRKHQNPNIHPLQHENSNIRRHQSRPRDVQHQNPNIHQQENRDSHRIRELPPHENPDTHRHHGPNIHRLRDRSQHRNLNTQPGDLHDLQHQHRNIYRHQNPNINRLRGLPRNQNPSSLKPVPNDFAFVAVREVFNSPQLYTKYGELVERFGTFVNDDVLPRGLPYSGDTSRMEYFTYRLVRGKCMKICVIGGSHSVPEPDKYATMTEDFLNTKYPCNSTYSRRHRFESHAVSSWGADIHYSHLHSIFRGAPKNISGYDLIIYETSSNMVYNDSNVYPYDEVMMRIMHFFRDNPAILIVQGGFLVVEYPRKPVVQPYARQISLAIHYGLPVISFATLVVAYFERFNYNQSQYLSDVLRSSLIGDKIHPTVAGYKIIVLLIGFLLHRCEKRQKSFLRYPLFDATHLPPMMITDSEFSVHKNKIVVPNLVNLKYSVGGGGSANPALNGPRPFREERILSSTKSAAKVEAFECEAPCIITSKILMRRKLVKQSIYVMYAVGNRGLPPNARFIMWVDYNCSKIAQFPNNSVEVVDLSEYPIYHINSRRVPFPSNWKEYRGDMCFHLYCQNVTINILGSFTA